jgi:hypothetical protein
VAQINQQSTPSGSISLPASGSVAIFSLPEEGGRLYIKDYQGNVYPAVDASGSSGGLITVYEDGTSKGPVQGLNFSGSAVDVISVAAGIATIGLSGGGGSGSGSSGSSGESGSSGSSGADGATGSSGTSGANGAPGTSGSSGANGAPGTSGSSGASGAAGNDGSSGSSGVSGAAGADGSSGSSGSSGADGDNGSSGTSGANGAPGTSGSSGADGNPGTSGSSGANGAQGDPGSSGTSGANGAQGDPGSSGTSGANGAPGTSGSSGANGAQGDPGSSGTSGANGAPGTSGSSGANGAQGDPGSSGTSGANGAPGTSGSSGANGAPGTSGSSGASGNPGTSGSSGASGDAGAPGSSGTSGASGSSGTSAAGGGGTPYNNIVRYEVTSSNDKAQVMSAGNIESGKSWSRSGTTISITSTAHGLTSGDYVVVRNMGATDYVYSSISNVSTNSFDITNAVNSGDTSGTDGVYIPAFDVSALSETALTLEAPSAGNVQLISLQVFINSSETGTITVTVPSNALENGAGKNNSLATRNVPQSEFYNVGGSTSSKIGSGGVSFNTSSNHNIYTLAGGLDTFGPLLYTLHF